jgi:hypothetical protein
MAFLLLSMEQQQLALAVVVVDTVQALGQMAELVVAVRAVRAATELLELPILAEEVVEPQAVHLMEPQVVLA